MKMLSLGAGGLAWTRRIYLYLAQPSAQCAAWGIKKADVPRTLCAIAAYDQYNNAYKEEYGRIGLVLYAP